MVMAELEVDQSHLPQVQEVCQCFSTLEDGALAHSLQEQEIEQYYSANVQKNQLVQNDIRIARQLQDEEEQQARQSRASRRLEEQDSEYARMIQEEIERNAEETRRREQEDEEMAKRLQEEEEMDIRQQRLASAYHSSTEPFALPEGGGPPPPGASLELGALRQVLLDEELARRLQEEEERLLAESPQSHPNLEKNEPEGDFRVAQVAQDEEIAHYIQHQERRSQRWSRDLEEEGPWRERRVRGDPCERRTGAERKVSQALRGRLDSEGLNSPGEDCSPEHQPSSPVSTVPPTQPMKNIAEELDPTFKAKRRGSNPSGQTTSGNCQSNSTPLAGVYDYVQEPTFVPPTKRQSSKSARPKAKDKKESCKQQ
ncbi:coiled-coil domain-containing protein 50 isoform X3 [Scleropages formosus]|uniref:Coiled-coil domain-containing protein 50-like n=1 Tax=Scleropages formosus TaxID=113540 RepID=A0A8C9R381_SCLFO|nr:coiled-coil domain-containing protein 50-like isoform X3 [Scleropages formosus]